MHPLLADPWVAAQIDEAVAPFRGLWSEGAVAAFREEMAATLATHPAAMRLLREARPPTQKKDPSGEVRVTGMVPAEAPSASKPATRSGTGTK